MTPLGAMKTGHSNSANGKGFAHRYPRHGGIEPICLQCFLTIAHCQTEQESNAAERSHVCEGDPAPRFFAYQWKGRRRA